MIYCFRCKQKTKAPRFCIQKSSNPFCHNFCKTCWEKISGYHWRNWFNTMDEYGTNYTKKEGYFIILIAGHHSFQHKEFYIEEDNFKEFIGDYWWKQMN